MASTTARRKRKKAPARTGRKKTTSVRSPSSNGRVAKPRRSPRARVGPVNEWFELRRSPIQGIGAFAITDIPKGTRIVEYTGERISNGEADRRYDDEAMRQHHTFLFILNKRTIVDAAFDGNEARFINHSCDPNCDTVIERGRIFIDAAKKIAAGDEITYDYSYDDDRKYTAKDYRFYGCQCGSPKCRGTIVKTRRKWR